MFIDMRVITKTVWILSLVSLFTDTASEKLIFQIRVLAKILQTF